MSKLRVAVLGASGIGKFHAKEFHNAGCEVVAILGSSLDSVEKTAGMLKQEFDINVQSYVNLSELLRSEEIDMVSICTPPKMHSLQIRECLESGLHVMCEKPFVLDNLSENHRKAKELINLAKEKGKIISVNTQWASIASILKENSAQKISSFGMYMEPPIPGAQNLIAETIPHLSSVLTKLIPTGKPENITFVNPNDEGVKVMFDYGSCKVQLDLGFKRERPRDLIFKINGKEFKRDIGEDYSQKLVHENGDIEISDPLMESVKAFIRAVNGGGNPLVSESDILRNVEIQDCVMKEYLNEQKAS